MIKHSFDCYGGTTSGSQFTGCLTYNSSEAPSYCQKRKRKHKEEFMIHLMTKSPWLVCCSWSEWTKGSCWIDVHIVSTTRQAKKWCRHLVNVTVYNSSEGCYPWTQWVRNAHDSSLAWISKNRCWSRWRNSVGFSETNVPLMEVID